jgi:hypothetical protein
MAAASVREFPLRVCVGHGGTRSTALRDISGRVFYDSSATLLEPTATPTADSRNAAVVRRARAGADAAAYRPDVAVDNSNSNGSVPPACTRAPDSSGTASSVAGLRSVAPQASAVFSEQILQRGVVEHCLGQQLFEPTILILQTL